MLTLTPDQSNIVHRMIDYCLMNECEDQSELYFKVRELQEQLCPEKGHVFETGTPVIVKECPDAAEEEFYGTIIKVVEKWETYLVRDQEDNVYEVDFSNLELEFS